MLLLAAAVAVAVGLPTRASGPSFWTVATAGDFLRGTSEGVYVSLNGVLTAGPQLTNRLTTAPAQIWSLAAGADGTFWAGTGGDGRIIRIRTGQPEQTIFDAEENNVFAIAVAGTRTYAATAPDGRIYAIEADGSTKPFFDPTEKYIWALAVDGSGRLWVGAGNPAVIYRVDASGSGQVVYRPPAAHVVSLARDASGLMLAGTESPGRLYRFSADDRPFVLLDSGLTELRAATTGPDGTIYAAAVAKGDESASGGETTSVAVTIASTTTPSPTTSTAMVPTRRSVLFRIDTNGSWESLWETPDLIYDVAADAEGVLVATGPEGRLYRVGPTREVFLLTGVDAKQITRFARSGTGNALTAFATANPGRVVSIGTSRQTPATYLSPVRDTKSASTWGLIRWEGRGPVVLYTRSGNTEKPDDSWSDWTGPYARREGEPVKSPAARFLQWRAVLTTPSPAPVPPELTGVTVAYLTRNSRPDVSSVTVHPPGVVFQRPFSSEDGAIAGLDDTVAEARRPPGDTAPPTPSPGRRMFQKGLQTLAWKAEDDDGDRLSYRLEYRREGETTWHELKADVPGAIYVWDTTAVADGRYVVRVGASDAPSNAADRALTGTRESEIVEVDNTPPTITTEVVRTAGAARLVVRVRDAQTPISKVEYSIGSGAWKLVYPVDGVADSPEERYEIPLANDADAARIIVRAIDLWQNVTSQPAAAK